MTAKALAAPLLLALALSACSSAPQHPAPQLPDTVQRRRRLPGRCRVAGQLVAPVRRPSAHRAGPPRHAAESRCTHAMARVDSARAQLRQSRAGLLPSFDLPGSASRQWIENDQTPNPAARWPSSSRTTTRSPSTAGNWRCRRPGSWTCSAPPAPDATAPPSKLRSAEAQTVAARGRGCQHRAGPATARAAGSARAAGGRHRGGPRTGAHRRAAVSRRRGDPAGRRGYIRRTRIAGSRSGRAGYPRPKRSWRWIPCSPSRRAVAPSTSPPVRRCRWPNRASPPVSPSTCCAVART